MSWLLYHLGRLLRVLRHGDHPWLPWYTIGRGSDLYLTRIYLTPRTPFGQGLFHIFHRGDADPDPHDHPWDFWTFPLKTYDEEVLEYAGNRLALVVHTVKRFRWHFRPSTHIHRVLYAIDKNGVKLAEPFYSIVWTTTRKRSWGFWPRIVGGRALVHWKRYFQAYREAQPGEPNWDELLETTYDYADFKPRVIHRDPYRSKSYE